jgi:chemotaxis signal transduction protein
MSAGFQPAKAASAQSAHQPNLLFSLGGMPCRLELKRLRAVVPWATLQPSTAKGVLGNLDFRGEQLPVIDMELTLTGAAAQRSLGTRILVLDCKTKGGNTRTIGALVSEAFAITLDTRELAEVERFDPCDVLPSMLAGIA